MSIPSIEERRKVAERLRRLDRTISSHSSTEEAIDEFLCALYGNATFPTIEMSPRNLCGAAVKLADLIEPEPERTCQIEMPVIDRETGETDYRCSSCGFSADPSDWAETYAHCPHCGARVVEP